MAPDVSYSKQANSLKIGKYRHYKGTDAEVIGVAVHSETLEEYVVYKHFNHDGVEMAWVRPLVMFLEEVEYEGKRIRRFEYVKNKLDS